MEIQELDKLAELSERLSPSVDDLIMDLYPPVDLCKVQEKVSKVVDDTLYYLIKPVGMLKQWQLLNLDLNYIFKINIYLISIMFQQISIIIKQYKITLIPSTTFEIHVFKFITKKQ